MNTRLKIIGKAEDIKLWNLQVYENLVLLLQTKYKFQKDLAKDLDISYPHLSKMLNWEFLLTEKPLKKWLDKTEKLINPPVE